MSSMWIWERLWRFGIFKFRLDLAQIRTNKRIDDQENLKDYCIILYTRKQGVVPE